MGVELAKKKLFSSDLILAVFDTGEAMSPEDKEIAESCRDKNAVAVLNKSDREQKFDFSEIEDCFKRSIICSAKEGKGLEELTKALEELFRTENISKDLSMDAGVLANERQRVCAENARRSFSEALQAFKAGATYDAVTVLVDEGENSLLELTGERASEAVVNEVFSRFCVGK